MLSHRIDQAQLSLGNLNNLLNQARTDLLLDFLNPSHHRQHLTQPYKASKTYCSFLKAGSISHSIAESAEVKA